MTNKKPKRQSLIETDRILQEKLQQLFMDRKNDNIEMKKELLSILTHEKSMEAEDKQLKIDINTDALTGLYNRRYFNQISVSEYARALRYNRPLSLLFIDIDDFKHYNDTYGHGDGDSVLAKFGETMQKNMRASDFAFRYGGEEFVVLLPEIGLKDAIKTAERIRKLFADVEFKPKNSDKIVKKTISIGVTEFKKGMDIGEFVNQADKAMYEAKKLGKNQVHAFE